MKHQADTRNKLMHIKSKCSRKRQTFPPVPPSGELDEIYALSLIRAYFLHYLETTSSTKPEIHKISHFRQRSTEPRPKVICT